MMTIQDIQVLITEDETKNLELKKTTGELKDGMHSACAFLNTGGGWLFFGVAPASLKILGQEVTDNTRREIGHALAGLEPALDIHVEYVDVPDRPGCQVIAMHFDGFVWGRSPYTYHGCPYYRIESTTKVMPREMFEERLRASKPQYFAWERIKADRIGIADLNEERVRGAVRLGVERGRMTQSALTEPFVNLLGKLQLLDGDVPNNAAAFLFGTNNYEYPQFRIRMARFRGTDKNEFIDNQRVDGNFFDLLDAGMSFFFKHLSLSGKIVGLYREEHLEVPVEALREALTNALCHRQWEKYNLTIGIAIYDDRIEIENPGMLPPQLTPETIREPHISYPYNPVMADVLFKTTFLENWGSGAGRIIGACREQNVPEPEWKIQGGFVVVTFKRPGYKVETELGESSTGQVPDKYRTSTGQVLHLIDILGDNEYSLKDMMALMKLKHRENFLENYLNPAIRSGFIEPLYPDQPRHPHQKYRLTQAGKNYRK